jgi:glutamyl-tRNA reductase
MEENFKSVSLTYKTAPVEIRELFALDESGCKKLMVSLREITLAAEFIVISTCNRTEVYYSSVQDFSTEIIKMIGIVKGNFDASQYIPYFNCITDHNEAISHLFEVAIGLDAQVVGDMQIGNQVKTAYQWSADVNMAGPFLHRLLHTIFFTNKKVVQETSFRDGAASVSYATVELAEELASEIVNPTVLVIGVGEMGADVFKNLLDSSIQNIIVTNRTYSKAEELAAGTRARVIPFEDAWIAIKESDIIVSSIARDEPFITKEKVKALNILSYKYFIDISVPRSVEASVEEIPGAITYHIDNIRNRATEALEKRIQAIPKVKEIIKSSIEEFNLWSKEMVVSPTINKLKNALEQIRQEELSRYTKQLNEEESKKVDMITRNIMQKIIKLPVLQLKAACKKGEAETLIDVLNDLFNLEKVSSEIKD